MFFLIPILSFVLFFAQYSPFAVALNCTADSAPCGTSTTCCPTTGYQCVDRRGIPLCEADLEEVRAGFPGPPCANPYLYNCNLSMGGFGCCPIGTMCYYGSLQSSPLVCKDVYGDPLPSHSVDETNFVSPALVAANENVLFSPQRNWSISSFPGTCNSGATVHVTSTVHSNITFNYTGPSIRIHTVTSPIGGVFGVFVDGFNTTSTIDTFSSSGESGCYPIQFPPFARAPPDQATKNQHSITLVYTGPSPDAANRSSSEVRFESFAIPDLQSQVPTSGCVHSRRNPMIFTLVSSLLMGLIYPLL